MSADPNVPRSYALIKRLRDELLDLRPCDHDDAEFVSENNWYCLTCDNTGGGARYAQDLEDSKRIAAVIAEADTYLAASSGYVLVPVEPTAAMLAAFVECPADELDLAYKAMILVIQKKGTEHEFICDRCGLRQSSKTEPQESPF